MPTILIKNLFDFISITSWSWSVVWSSAPLECTSWLLSMVIAICDRPTDHALKGSPLNSRMNMQRMSVVSENLYEEFWIWFPYCLDKMFAKIVRMVLLLATVTYPCQNVSDISVWIVGDVPQQKGWPCTLEVPLPYGQWMRATSMMVVFQNICMLSICRSNLINQDPNKMVKSWTNKVMKELVFECMPEILHRHCCVEMRNTRWWRMCPQRPPCWRIPLCPQKSPDISKSSLLTKLVHLLYSIMLDCCSITRSILVRKKGMLTEVFSEQMENGGTMDCRAEDILRVSWTPFIIFKIPVRSIFLILFNVCKLLLNLGL